MIEVLSALDAAHQLGVIHRDIKPGNILLGPDGHAKVADFGIAKLAEDSDQTTAGLVFGTAAYLAPERLAGQPASPASDLYSVGVVLFEALTGRPPFRADTPLVLLASISRDDPQPIGELCPDAQPALIAAVERAIDKDPYHRFESASTMAAALAAANRPDNVPTSDTPTLPIATRRAASAAPTPPTREYPSPVRTGQRATTPRLR